MSYSYGKYSKDVDACFNGEFLSELLTKKGRRVMPNNYRQCFVDGKKALFHRWVDEEKLYLKIGFVVHNQARRDQLEDILNAYNEKGIILNGADTEKVKTTLGLIEYEDGYVEKVDPIKIRFIDGDSMFNDYSWEVDVKEY